VNFTGDKMAKTRKVYVYYFGVFLGLILFLMLNADEARSQNEAYRYMNTRAPFDSLKARNLSVRFENANFFRNNEYKSPVVDGYTLIGLWGRFLMEYYPANNLRLQVGGHFLKYHGSEPIDKHKSMPYYTIQYNPFHNMEIIFGNFNNNRNMGLLEMLYEPENYFTEKPPGGLQVRYANKWLTAQTWINWENFIFPGDSLQEVFTNGSLVDLELIDRENFQLSVPVQFMYYHEGGEIDSANKEIQTLMNGAAGLNFRYRAKRWTFGAEGYYLGYREATANRRQLFTAGYGGLARLSAAFDRSVVSVGYWQGDRYLSPKGRVLYQSYVLPANGEIHHRRQLLEGRLVVDIPVKYGVTFAVEADTFYDLTEGDFSYCWGLHLMFSESFFLRKINERN
jgi:hypothetical protein